MTIDPRAALAQLVSAFEEHLLAVENRRGEEDPAVDDAYYRLADAVDQYDEALGQVFSEALPFYLAEDDDLDEDDELSDDDDEEEDDLDNLDDDDLDDDDDDLDEDLLND